MLTFLSSLYVLTCHLRCNAQVRKRRQITTPGLGGRLFPIFSCPVKHVRSDCPIERHREHPEQVSIGERKTGRKVAVVLYSVEDLAVLVSLTGTTDIGTVETWLRNTRPTPAESVTAVLRTFHRETSQLYGSLQKNIFREWGRRPANS